MTILNYAKIGLRHQDAATRDKALSKILAAAQRAEKITNGVLGLAEAGDFDIERWTNAVINLNTKPNGVFGTKIISHFLFRALNLGSASGADFLASYKDKTKIIYLERHDKVAQAISRLFAREAQVYNVRLREKKKQRNEVLQDLDYDYDRLAGIVDSLEKEEAKLRDALYASGPDVHEVAYEALDKDAEPEVLKILEFLDIDIGPNFEFMPTNIKKVRDERNKEFYDRFQQDRRNRGS